MNPRNTYTKGLTPSLTNIRSTPTKVQPKSYYNTMMTGDSSKLTLNKPMSDSWKKFNANQSVASGTVAPKKPVQGPVQPTVTPSNVSATGTATPALSPAGQQYASQLQSIKDSALGIKNTLNAKQENDKKQDPEYLRYLRSLENPTEATNLQKQRENALKTLTDIQTKKEQQDTDARRRYEELLDESGGLKAGAQQSATMDRRRSEQELADIALQENAAARTAGVYNDLYTEQMANEKKEGFNLGANDTRYEWDPETKTYKQYGGGSASTESAYGGAGSNPTVDSYIANIQNGSMKMSDVPEEYLSAVSQGLSTQPKQRSQINQQATSVIDELLANPKLDRIFGPADQFVGGIFGEAAVARNKFNQLKGLLSLENIKYLKGTGAISDAEQRLLANASTALGRNLGNAQARQVLTDLKRELETLYVPGGTNSTATGEDVQLPDGTVINTSW